MTQLPRRILVPTDFSPTADAALALASRLAARFSAELLLLHVQVLLDDPHLPEGDQEQLERLMERAEEQIRRIMDEQVHSGREVAVGQYLVRGFSPAETIVQAASNLSCDLVVMGTHGRRGLRRLILGSVAERVVSDSPVPVLTVRGDSEPVESLAAASILVPHDFSEQSLAAVRTALYWAERLGARATLLHVVEPVVYPDFYAVDIMPRDLQQRLEERSHEALSEVADAELAGIQSNVVVATGHASETILLHSESHDLIIMGTRGLSALAHLLLGSSAERVVRNSLLPVLTVRGD